MSTISLDYAGNFNRFDTEGMYDQIVSLSDQINTVYFEMGKSEYAKYYKNIDKIFICGMGGSAIAGDIVKSLYESKIPIFVIKDYNILDFIDENSLGIVCSYSGNTAETVSCFDALREKGAQIAMITSGGILKHFSSEEGYLVKLIPSGFQPRAAIGYMFFSLLGILEELGFAKRDEVSVKMMLLNIKQRLQLINKDIPTKNNMAKKLAEMIFKKVPIIYSSNPKLYPLAYRFKCQINENAKNHAFSNTFSEMNHNEIEGWEDKSSENLIPVFITDYDENQKYMDRLDTIKKKFKEEKIEFLEIRIEGKTILGKMFSTIMYCDMISYYLAVLNKINPSSIQFIDYLKQNV